MADRPVDLLPAMPRLGALFAKAVLPTFHRGPARVPETTAMVIAVQPDPSRLADYDRVCGFMLRDHVPATWMHPTWIRCCFAIRVRRTNSGSSATLCQSNSLRTPQGAAGRLVGARRTQSTRMIAG